MSHQSILPPEGDDHNESTGDPKPIANRRERETPTPNPDSGTPANPPPDPSKREVPTPNPDSGTPANPPPDPFDPASLRISGDPTGAAGVKKAILSIPTRKPDKAWFIRVHPSDAYQLNTCVIELKEDRETYLVSQELWPALAGETTFSPRAIFTAMNRQGVPFVWPVRLPGSDGKLDEWSRTALEAAEMAKRDWCRVTANMNLGAYEVWQALGELPKPTWPGMTLQEILRIAFRDRYISSLDHPVLRKLRGEL
jgi:hypothetical protein